MVCPYKAYGGALTVQRAVRHRTRIKPLKKGFGVRDIPGWQSSSRWAGLKCFLDIWVLLGILEMLWELPKVQSRHYMYWE